MSDTKAKGGGKKRIILIVAVMLMLVCAGVGASFGGLRSRA
jgi:flagellar basal body-associated protein FliL